MSMHVVYYAVLCNLGIEQKNSLMHVELSRHHSLSYPVSAVLVGNGNRLKMEKGFTVA